MRFRHFFLIPVACLMVQLNAIGQQDPVDLYTTSGVGVIGNVIKVEVKANSFTDIIAFQASLNWDPTLLKYIGVGDFGINDFGENSFGTTSTSLGHLRFLWEPSDAIALTVSDSTVLFSASFEIISDQAQNVSIGYVDIASGDGFIVEFANDNYEILTVNTFDGNISIAADPVTLVNIETIANISCDEDFPNGSLKADVEGDSINFIFHWFAGPSVGTTPDYVGYRYDDVASGEYTLQIQDLSGNIFVEAVSASVLDESNPIELILDSAYNNFCMNGANGVASASVVKPDNRNLRYYWFHEGDMIDTTQARFDGAIYNDLAAGKYTSWVIDLMSECIAFDDIIVEDSLIYNEAIITQSNDTLYASADNADWYRNQDLVETGKPYVTPNQSGNYSILIVNEYGCESESESLYYGVTGLEELTPEISVYPNPFNDFLRISNERGEIDFIQVYSTKGVLIQEFFTIKDKFMDVHLSGSSDGIYLLRIGKDGVVYSRKVIKNLSK